MQSVVLAAVLLLALLGAAASLAVPEPGSGPAPGQGPAPEPVRQHLMPQLHHGLHFEPVTRVLAASAKLVLFPVKLNLPASAEAHNLTVLLQSLLLKQTPGLNKTIGNVTRQLEELHHRLDSHIRDVKSSVSRGMKGRIKRSPLDFVSVIGRYAFGFSTYDDTRLLSENDQILRDWIEDREAIVQREIVVQWDAVTSLAVELNEKIPELALQVHKLKYELKLSNVIGVKVAMVVALVNALSAEKLLVMERLRSVEAACLNNHIPSTLVTRVDLDNAIAQVNKAYLHRQRVAVGVDQLYKLEIAACKFHGEHDTLMVEVKLPLEPTAPGGPGWHAQDVIPLGFLHEREVCQLLPRPVLAVTASSGGVVRLLEDEQRTLCLAKSICDVPRFVEAQDSACVGAVFARAETDELKRACAFTCRPYHRIEITHVGGNLYSVVNADRTLVRRCPTERGAAVAPEAVVPDEVVELRPQSLGALLVEMPCACTLADADGGAVLLERREPCAHDYTDAVNVTLHVPRLWAADHYAALVANLSAASVEPLDVSVFVSSDWKVNVPTFEAPELAELPSLANFGKDESAMERLLRDARSMVPVWVALVWELLSLPLFVLLWLRQHQLRCTLTELRLKEKD